MKRKIKEIHKFTPEISFILIRINYFFLSANHVSPSTKLLLSLAQEELEEQPLLLPVF